MINHVVSDELFAGEFATIRDAYRVGDGNSTIRATCEDQVYGPDCVVLLARSIVVAQTLAACSRRGQIPTWILDPRYPPMFFTPCLVLIPSQTDKSLRPGLLLPLPAEVAVHSLHL